MVVKIISWNIQQGGGSRVSEICSEIIKSEAHIVCLNEFKNNESGIKIRTNLLRAGYIHQLVGEASKSDNTVLTASKLPFDGSHFSIQQKEYPQAIVSTKFKAFTLYNMYLPHKKKHNLFDLIVEEMKMQDRGIFVGDFNSGKQYIDQKGNSFMYSEYFDKMEAQNYRDAWRNVHGDTLEYSWYSHQGNGYRYDHIYIHESILPVVKNCYYLHEWRLRKLSDHSAMVLELG